MTNFPTRPGASFEYRGVKYWVIETRGRMVIAETSDCKRGYFYN